MQAKKHRLSIDFDEEPASFILFGISGTHKAVKLAWEINQVLDLDFKLSDRITIDNQKKGQVSEHPYFSYFDEENLVSYHLFVNKSFNQSLVPELSKLDFLLKIDDPNEQVDPDEILSKLKEINSLNFIIEIDIDKLKHFENLLIS